MLSMASKHAIRAMIYLAQTDSASYVSVSEIARKTKLPATYLTKIIKTLAQRRLVQTKRGSSGGVRLAVSELSFFDVCQALKDPILTETCILSRRSCSSTNSCSYHSTWSYEKRRIHSLLKSSLISQSNKKHS